MAIYDFVENSLGVRPTDSVFIHVLFLLDKNLIFFKKITLISMICNEKTKVEIRNI